MRIALVTDAWHPQVNGVVSTWSHVCDEAATYGHEMMVIHPGMFRTVPCPAYPEIRLSCFPRRPVARMLDNGDVDAIHIPAEGTLGLAARRYCIRRKIPFTTSYHTQYALYLKRYYRLPAPITYKGLKWFHSAAAKTLVPSPSVRDELEQRGFKNLLVWTRGVDTDLFQPYGKDLLDDERPIFMYVGRVSREKNLEAFLGDDKLPGTKYVVGDGPALNSLKQKFPKARFVGYKHGLDLARHFSSADVFVFPSLTDTFGVVLLEAMACGVPVAAYPCTGPIDVVDQGRTGFLDKDLTKAAMAALELDPEDCRKHAVTFSWQKCAELFFDSVVPIHGNGSTNGRKLAD